MRYDRLAGVFGGFDGEMEFGEGLNVVCAGNESGKSTLSALILTLLYGLNTSEREKKGFLPDKLRYAPWSGKPMQGSLTLTKGGRQIELRRSTVRNAPMQSFLAAYTDSGFAVEGVDASNCGEAMTGVTREVFTRSAFCRGEALALSDSGELERRIQAISAGGDESVSAAAAVKLLSAWKNERYANRSNGLIPRLDAEIAGLEAELARAGEINAMIGEKDRDMLSVKTRLASLEAAAEKGRLAMSARKLGRIKTARETAAAAREAAESFPGLPSSELTAAAIAALDARDSAPKAAEVSLPPALAGVKREEFAAKAREDGERAAALSAKKSLLPWIITVVACSAALVFLNPFVALAALAGGLTAAVLALGSKNRKNRAAAAAICEGYGVTLPGDIAALAAGRLAALERADEAAAAAALAEKNAAAALAAAGLAPDARREELSRLAGLSAEKGRADAAAAAADAALAALLEECDEEQLSRDTDRFFEMSDVPDLLPEQSEKELSKARAELELLRSSEAGLRGRLSSLRDTAELSARAAALRRAKEAAQAELDAITAASAIIESCSEELSRRLTPALTRRAGELLSRLTAGRHDRITVRRGFETEVGEGKLSADPLYLSRGGADQTYLALRIAVSELAFPGELPPLVLDDVFAAFDDERVELAAGLLAELSRERQIILLTCRSREAEAALRLGGRAIKI